MSGEGLTFVDTNVLLYAHDASEQLKQPVAQGLLQDLWADRAGVVSTQVLQEFYVVATRKFRPAMPRSTARSIIALYASWPVIEVDTTLIIEATALEETAQLSFWDALIIEAARRAGATRVASEDLQHGQVFSGIEVIDPFRHASDRPVR